MNLKKCSFCLDYTLEEICLKCGRKTCDAHYKFVRIKNGNNFN